MARTTVLWRVPSDVAERVEKLIATIAADPILGKGGQLGEEPQRVDVLRLLLTRGCASVEGEINGRKGAATRAPK